MPLIKNKPEAEDVVVASPWHALYTRHQHEKTVAQILSNRGHEVFLPLYSTAHRWQDRTKQLSLPLFPCYVFLRGGLDRRLQVLSTPGICTIVGWAGHPAVIPQVEIDAVRQLVESPLRIEPHPFLKCGDRVRVRSGPLQGLEGFLVRKKSLFRLVISVEMLGRSAAVEVDAHSLERVSFSPSPTTSDRVSSSVPAHF
jgi:transcription antitermination factor NusG